MKKKGKIKISLKRQLSRWFGMIYVSFFGIVLITLIISIFSYHFDRKMQIEGKLEKATINIASDIEQITKFVLQIFWNEEEIETLKKNHR